MGRFAEAEEMCYKWELLLYLDIMATLFLWQNWFHWAFELARSQQKCHGQVILGQLVLTPSSPRATFAFPLPWLGLYLFYLTKWHAWLRQSKGNTDLAIWALYKGKVCFRSDVFIPSWMMIQGLPEVKSDELSTINAELKKLGISGDRGELTQAGRDLAGVSKSSKNGVFYKAHIWDLSFL